MYAEEGKMTLSNKASGCSKNNLRRNKPNIGNKRKIQLLKDKMPYLEEMGGKTDQGTEESRGLMKTQKRTEKP